MRHHNKLKKPEGVRSVDFSDEVGERSMPPIQKEENYSSHSLIQKS